MSGKSAAVIALELYNEPRLAKRLSMLPVHGGVLSLIKIAAGDEGELLVFPNHIASNPEKAREISVFYLQQVLFHPKSNGLRLLGLSPGASPEQLRDHKRWLVKWLHPDRNPNTWEQHHFKRVMVALDSLQNKDGQELGEVQKFSQANQPNTKNAFPKRARTAPKKQYHLRLNVWSRVKGRLKQFAVLAAIAFAIYLGSAKSDVISTLTRGLPSIASMLH